MGIHQVLLSLRLSIALGAAAAFGLFASSASAQDDRYSLVRTLEFKQVTSQPTRHNDRVLFSQYDATGNTQDLVEVDTSNATYRQLLKGLNSPTLVADSDKYLVYSTQGSNANPLVVVSKKTGEKTAQKRLNVPIVWGHIDADRLLVLQKSAAPGSELLALVFHLPDLHLEKSSVIEGGDSNAIWQDKIVSLGVKLNIYDLNFRQISQIELPPKNPNFQNNCHAGPLRVEGNKAVFGAGCGQLAVADLPSATLQIVIPTSSNFQSFDVSEGLIFTSAVDDELATVKVIELSTGRELTQLDIKEPVLSIRGNRLLGMTRTTFSAPVRFALYEIDLAAIKSEKQRAARVVELCKSAQQLVAVDSNYHAAIEACERAGVNAYIDGATPAPDVSAAVMQYGIWLARSLSRYQEGQVVLNRFASSMPSSESIAAKSEAQKKIEWLGGVSTKERQQRPVARVSNSIRSFLVELDPITDLFRFEGDRIYIARWGCSGSSGVAVALDVLDRKSFRLIKRVDVAPCDDQEQDAISSIALTDGFIVLGMQYRFPEEGRPTVTVIDAGSLDVVKRNFLSQSTEELREWKGKLLTCATEVAQPSHRFDPLSARLVAASDEEARACANAETTSATGGSFNPVDARNPPVAETPGFRVFADPGLRPTYRATSRDSGASAPLKLSPRQYGDIKAVPGRDDVLMRSSTGVYSRFTRYRIQEKQETPLLELRTDSLAMSWSVWRNLMFISLGRDLIVYDLDTLTIRDYQSDPNQKGFRDNCCGVDLNAIARLIIDGDRLIAMSGDGANSFFIDLPAYVRELPATDFFRR